LDFQTCKDVVYYGRLCVATISFISF